MRTESKTSSKWQTAMVRLRTCRLPQTGSSSQTVRWQMSKWTERR